MIPPNPNERPFQIAATWGGEKRKLATMAKSMRSKKEKRLRAIRREMVEPLYEKKEEAKYAALEAALNAPKLPVRTRPDESTSMDAAAVTTTTSNADMGTSSFFTYFLYA